VGRARDKLVGGSHRETRGPPADGSRPGAVPGKGPMSPRESSARHRPVFRVRDLTGLPRVMTKKPP